MPQRAAADPSGFDVGAITDWEAVTLEPLLKAFVSKDPDEDTWLRDRAYRAHEARTAATYVAFYRQALVGFVAVLADVQRLSSSERKKLDPHRHDDHPNIPAVKVAHLAVERAHNDQYAGTGKMLMRFALVRARSVFDHAGTACRILTLDSTIAARPFYDKLGFRVLKGTATGPTAAMFHDTRPKTAPSWFGA